MAEENTHHLRAAIAILIQSHAELAKDMTQSRREFEELRRLMIYYGESLAKLPEAIRERVGLKQ